MQCAGSLIFDHGWCDQSNCLRDEQRTKLQHEPDQDRQTASPVAVCLPPPPPLMRPCTLRVHDSFGLARIHSYAVKANPVRSDEVPSHYSGKGQCKEDGEPDYVKGQSERVEFLRQEHMNSAD